VHPWRTMIAVSVLLSLLGWESGCSQKSVPPPPAAPEGASSASGAGKAPGQPAGGKSRSGRKIEVGEDLPLAHVHPVKGGESFQKPAGWICTCQFGVPQTILIAGSLEDPELLAAAQRADEYAAKVGEKQAIAVVVVPGPPSEERLAAARKWQEQHQLDHTLVTVAHGEGDWKQLGAPEKTTLLLADEANLITFKQVGFNEANRADFEAALTGPLASPKAPAK